MAARKCNHREAFTLVEVLVTAVAAVILIVGISAMLFYGQRGYNTMYRRINSEVVRNAYEARRVFDAIVRKSTIERYDPLPPEPDEPYIGNELCIYYYTDPADPDPTNIYPDRYAYFHLEGTDLILEQGGSDTFFTGLPPRVSSVPSLPDPDRSMVLARNVGNVERGIPVFSKHGPALRMVLVLDDESNPEPEENVYSETLTLKMVVTTTAVRHNKFRQ